MLSFERRCFLRPVTARISGDCQYLTSQKPQWLQPIENQHFLLKKGLPCLGVSICWSLLRSVPSSPPLSSAFPYHAAITFQADFVRLTCFCPHKTLGVFKCSPSPSFTEDKAWRLFLPTFLVVVLVFLEEKKVDWRQGCYQVPAGTGSSWTTFYKQ